MAKDINTYELEDGGLFFAPNEEQTEYANGGYKYTPPISKNTMSRDNVPYGNRPASKPGSGKSVSGTTKDFIERGLSAASLSLPFPYNYGASILGSGIDFYDAYNAKDPQVRNALLAEGALGLIPYGKAAKGLKLSKTKAIDFSLANKILDLKDLIYPDNDIYSSTVKPAPVSQQLNPKVVNPTNSNSNSKPATNYSKKTYDVYHSKDNKTVTVDGKKMTMDQFNNGFFKSHPGANYVNHVFEHGGIYFEDGGQSQISQWSIPQIPINAQRPSEYSDLIQAIIGRSNEYVDNSLTPELWEKRIRDVESKIGNPSTWTIDSYNQLQNTLNDYKNWRENTKEGKAVYDSHNEPNEYVVPLPDHLKGLYNKTYADGGQQLDRFKKRLMKRYPGMQGVYGSEGQNLNIIKDPNYAAADYGYGNIEFIQPGDGTVTYSDDYKYVSPTPDKYTAVFNPKGANRGDVFLDMMHGMRDDEGYMKLLNAFTEKVKAARGDDMKYFYEQEAKNGYTDGQDQWERNYIDGQLRAQLAPGTIGMFSHGRKDYRQERKYDTPEMEQAAREIRDYLKGRYEDGGEIEMGGGGYTVTRSHDRKGKTHKVTGPDGTVKYFGDSNLGQHPNDPKRKAAFYARHKHNLEHNPYFRAFARKTWEEGGEVDNDKEMLEGVADMLRRVDDKKNRKEIANYMMDNFRDEDVAFLPNEFLEDANALANGGMIKRADGSYSQRGLWDNIRANKGSGKKPTKEMLKQEKKIKSKYQNGGMIEMEDGGLFFKF